MISDKQKKYLTELIKKHRFNLILDIYKINIVYNETDDCDQCDDVNTLACTTIDSKYYSADIKIHPKFWKQREDEQEQTIIHELFHVITSPGAQISLDLLDGKHRIKDQITTEEERMTEHLTRIYSLLLK